MQSLLQFDRRVRRGEDPVQVRNLNPCNRLQEPVRTFASPDWETLCRAMVRELGKEDCVGMIRSGPQLFGPRSSHPATTPHGDERAGPFIRPDRKSCPPRPVGPFRAPLAIVGPPATK